MSRLIFFVALSAKTQKARPASWICGQQPISASERQGLADERTRSAGGLCVMVWGHGSGLIAILIEEVGLGSDDGCSFNRTGATSYE
ncbi:MAG: hypothetical protein ACK5XZ_10490, partial [Hyphomonadaceae bacterium]